ncbi:hypothetical protein D3C84_950880 [compost metagenome]
MVANGIAIGRHHREECLAKGGDIRHLLLQRPPRCWDFKLFVLTNQGEHVINVFAFHRIGSRTQITRDQLLKLGPILWHELQQGFHHGGAKQTLIIRYVRQLRANHLLVQPDKLFTQAMATVYGDALGMLVLLVGYLLDCQLFRLLNQLFGLFDRLSS